MVSHLYNISFIFLTSPFMVDFIVYIRVIRVIRSTNHPLFSFVIMSFCLQENHLSPFVIMSFCLQEFPFLRLSLCYSVSKKSSVFIRLYVILSSKKSFVSICHYVILSSRKSSISIFHYVILSSRKTSFFICHYVILSQKNICLHLSLCHSVFKNPPVFVRLPVILSLIYSVCLMLKCLYKEAYKGPEKRRGICIRSEYVTIMYSVGYR